MKEETHIREEIVEEENMNCQQVSSLMPRALGSVLKSVSTQELSSANCETGPNQNALAMPIGKPLSATVLDGLRNLARLTDRDSRHTDASLEALLRQHFGQRLVINRRTKPCYSGDGGYEEKPVGIDIELDGLGEPEMKFFDAVEFFNRPSRPDQIAACVARMRMTLLRTSEENADIEVLVDTLIDLCRDYPADVVAGVSREWMRTKRFFPIPKEFIAELDQAVSFRRAILRRFEEVRNPVFVGNVEAKRIARDPRLSMHYKELPRKDWLPIHYEWWVGDAERMIKLSKDNGRNAQADEWQVEFERRQSEAKTA